jgi:hypothetical protein
MKEPAGMESGCSYAPETHRDAVTEIIVNAIRERSAAAQLISEAEIMSLLNERQYTISDTDKKVENAAAILPLLIQEKEDLHRLAGTESHYYYSSDYMTEAYAIILLHKLDGPLHMIAETVRRNSSAYRRPVPLDIFTQPPFNLEDSQIVDCLDEMTKTDGYDDIATTSTSASTIYLYSTSHLETDHAVMLAEWLDVGQADNP